MDDRTDGKGKTWMEEWEDEPGGTQSAHDRRLRFALCFPSHEIGLPVWALSLSLAWGGGISASEPALRLDAAVLLYTPSLYSETPPIKFSLPGMSIPFYCSRMGFFFLFGGTNRY